MLRGLLVVNAFLRTSKFDGIYRTLLDAAQALPMKLDVATNAELCCRAPEQCDFVLFWDKDVALASRLERQGLPVFNSADSILKCDDKALTYQTLLPAGMPMPHTIVAPKTFPNVGYTDTAFLDDVAAQLGFPMIVKECFGSFGQQVYLCRTMAELRQKVLSLAGLPLLFQELVQHSYGRDIRINVVGGRIVASMLRESRNGDFRSNITLGGGMSAYTPNEAEAALALLAVRKLGLTFAGVDVLFGENGPLLCEVNSNAHFKTTLECTGVNMAEAILRYICDALEGKL